MTTCYESVFPVARVHVTNDNTGTGRIADEHPISNINTNMIDAARRPNAKHDQVAFT